MNTAPTLPGVVPLYRPNPLSSPAFGPAAPPSLAALRGHRFLEGEQGAGGGDGAGSTGNGAPPAGAGSTGNGEQGVDAATAKALREQADKLMRERNAARDQAKTYADLGLSVEQIRELKAAAEKANGGPTPEQVAEQARKDAEKTANERVHARARISAVREQAAALGFHEPKDAIALLDAKALSDVSVGDDDEADAAAVRKLLDDLAKARPYLVKNPTASASYAGIGSTGAGAAPDPGPGTARIRAAYAEHAAAR